MCHLRCILLLVQSSVKLFPLLYYFDLAAAPVALMLLVLAMVSRAACGRRIGWPMALTTTTTSSAHRAATVVLSSSATYSLWWALLHPLTSSSSEVPPYQGHCVVLFLLLPLSGWRNYVRLCWCMYKWWLDLVVLLPLDIVTAYFFLILGLDHVVRVYCISLIRPCVCLTC
jgi:hypothetical protein